MASKDLVRLDEESPKPVTRRLGERGRRRLLIGGAVALAVLALCGGSVTFGWWLATNSVVAAQSHPGTELVEVPVGMNLEGEIVMPDVRGLPTATALEVLADAGIEVSLVALRDRPAAGTSDLIIEQTPAFGAADPTEITLVSSTPAAVPDVVGASKDEATDALIELGSRVELVGVYDPDAALDVVRAVEPVAGSALPERVVLTVTAAPSSVYLAQLERSGSCTDESDLVMNGSTYASGMTCSSSSTGRETSWQLSKAVDVVTGTFAVPDSADPGASVHVQLLADGVQLQAFDVAYGQQQAVTVRTTGVLRLTMIVTSVGGASTQVGLGDVTALGASAPMAALPRR